MSQHFLQLSQSKFAVFYLAPMLLTVSILWSVRNALVSLPVISNFLNFSTIKLSEKKGEDRPVPSVSCVSLRSMDNFKCHSMVVLSEPSPWTRLTTQFSLKEALGLCYLDGASGLHRKAKVRARNEGKLKHTFVRFPGLCLPLGTFTQSFPLEFYSCESVTTVV